MRPPKVCFDTVVGFTEDELRIEERHLNESAPGRLLSPGCPARTGRIISRPTRGKEIDRNVSSCEAIRTVSRRCQWAITNRTTFYGYPGACKLSLTGERVGVGVRGRVACQSLLVCHQRGERQEQRDILMKFLRYARYGHTGI